MPKHLLVLPGLSLLALTGCGLDQPEADGPPLVVTTFSVLADMAETIGGDSVEVRSITPIGAEVHAYDPTPSDVQAAADADLIIKNGLGLEEWFEQFIAHSDAPTVTASEGIQTRPITRLPGHPDDPGPGADLPEDPHGWVSPEQSQIYIDNIEAALTELAPEDAEQFAQRAADYREQLETFTEESRAQAAAAPAPVLVTCEGAFGYLADDLGFSEHYLWPLNAENEGTPQQVEAQIRFVEENEVETIFCESTVNEGAQSQVAETTGAELAGPLYVDSLTEADGPAATHLELLQHTTGTILGQTE
ncbi:metal ABC transporter solute-binding protein, Zn/Mn family [Nesterenkonia sphaerica]|uniref:Metal ABC transporter substrate-binding protein n=1 Tax=Nesterenkonia sphaerica TaxID=1804988 RepID=A0A5R9AH50_9MICC|nr:zinc ABC transporter substrate-binding protein [Nesterenkonia sphaerica]TLP77375.1 metal ABC transporter substrate-binding protein [Nesterenkonia sphaerica]